MKDNKLIAEFMGLEPEKTLENKIVYAHKTVNSDKINDIQTDFYEAFELKYYLSWDWLMLVVEKIEAMKSPVYISSNCCTIYEYANFNIEKGDYFTEVYADTKINAVYQAVIKFITWYNEKKSIED